MRCDIYYIFRHPVYIQRVLNESNRFENGNSMQNVNCIYSVSALKHKRYFEYAMNKPIQTTGFAVLKCQI